MREEDRHLYPALHGLRSQQTFMQNQSIARSRGRRRHAFTLTHLFPLPTWTVGKQTKQNNCSEQMLVLSEQKQTVSQMSCFGWNNRTNSEQFRNNCSKMVVPNCSGFRTVIQEQE